MNRKTRAVIRRNVDEKFVRDLQGVAARGEQHGRMVELHWKDLKDVCELAMKAVGQDKARLLGLG